MLVRTRDEDEEDDQADDGEDHDKNPTEHPIVGPGAVHGVLVVQNVPVLVLVIPGHGQVHFDGNLAPADLTDMV